MPTQAHQTKRSSSGRSFSRLETTLSEMPACRLVRSGQEYVGLQNLSYLAGLTGATAGARAICLNLAIVPPGARAKAHLHRGIETAVYVIEGEAAASFGNALREVVIARAGDYVYIPADLPHVVVNRSAAGCRAIVAHSAADDQAGIVLLPELDALV